MVASHGRCAPVADLSRLCRECVPDAGCFSVFIGGTFDLRRRCRDAPDEILGKSCGLGKAGTRQERQRGRACENCAAREGFLRRLIFRQFCSLF
jgi:hypothetical protein